MYPYSFDVAPRGITVKNSALTMLATRAVVQLA